MRKLVVVASRVQAAEETYGKPRPEDVVADFTRLRWLHDNGDETWFVGADHIDFPQRLIGAPFDELELRVPIPFEHERWIRTQVLRAPVS